MRFINFVAKRIIIIIDKWCVFPRIVWFFGGAISVFMLRSLLFPKLTIATLLLDGLALFNYAYQFFSELFLQLILESFDVNLLHILILFKIVDFILLTTLFLLPLRFLLRLFFLSPEVLVELISLLNVWLFFFPLHLFIGHSSLQFHLPSILFGLLNRELHHKVNWIHLICSCFIYNNKDE